MTNYESPPVSPSAAEGQHKPSPPFQEERSSAKAAAAPMAQRASPEENLKPAAKSRAELESMLREGAPAMSLQGVPAEVQRKALYDAVDRIPQGDKEAYLQALKHGLEHGLNLIETELDPLYFLGFEDYNVQPAAERLVAYWKLRQDLFQDRAFLPIADLSGNGAIKKEDLEYWRTGGLIQLPNKATGDSALCIDVERIGKSVVKHVVASRPQMLMLFLNKIAMENPKKGVELVRIIAQEDWDRNKPQPTMIRMETSLPIKITAVRVLCVLSNKGRRFFQETIKPVFQSTLTKSYGSRGTLHSGDSPLDAFRQLEKLGFNKTGLPPSLGGTWNYKDFEEWFAKKRSGDPSLEAPPAKRLHVASEPTQQVSSPAVASPAFSSSVPSRNQQDSFAIGAPAPVDGTRYGGRFGPQVIQALTMLPVETKAAYLEALERAPELVEKESSAHAFYQFEGGDADAAARRLAGYWTKRKEIFGDKKAFLPMTQTGEGALSRSDMHVLCTCYFIQLPNDHTGRTVLCYDGSRLEKCTKDSRLRLAFYMFSLAVEAETDGCVLLCIKKKKPKSPNRDRHDSLGPVIDVLPIKIKGLHLIDRQRADPAKTVAAVHALFGDSVVPKTYVHDESLRSEIIEKLAVFGLSKAGLPKSLGGDWGYAKLTQWQELRTRQEWGLPGGSSAREANNMFIIPEVTPMAQLVGEERAERKRRMNVVHSRRKRERERIEIEVLQEQCQEMGETNDALADENLRFEHMLTEANSKVARLQKGGVLAAAELPAPLSNRCEQSSASIPESSLQDRDPTSRSRTGDQPVRAQPRTAAVAIQLDLRRAQLLALQAQSQELETLRQAREPQAQPRTAAVAGQLDLRHAQLLALQAQSQELETLRQAREPQAQPRTAAVAGQLDLRRAQLLALQAQSQELELGTLWQAREPQAQPRASQLLALQAQSQELELESLRQARERQGRAQLEQQLILQQQMAQFPVSLASRQPIGQTLLLNELLLRQELRRHSLQPQSDQSMLQRLLGQQQVLGTDTPVATIMELVAAQQALARQRDLGGG